MVLVYQRNVVFNIKWIHNIITFLPPLQTSVTSIVASLIIIGAILLVCGLSIQIVHSWKDQAMQLFPSHQCGCLKYRTPLLRNLLSPILVRSQTIHLLNCSCEFNLTPSLHAILLSYNQNLFGSLARTCVWVNNNNFNYSVLDVGKSAGLSMKKMLN